MRVSVFGLGYVGCVSIGCLSKLGHKLIGVEIGVGQGLSMFEVLEKCELIKMYYGIDSYLPFEDHITYGKESRESNFI